MIKLECKISLSIQVEPIGSYNLGCTINGMTSIRIIPGTVELKNNEKVTHGDQLIQ